MTHIVPLDSLARRIPIVANEAWRWVPFYEGLYAVSNHGRVASFHRHNGDPGPRLLQPGRDSSGYPLVVFHGLGVKWTRLVHRAVLDAFVGPLPEGQESRHLDGDPSNNRLTNLAYGSVSENAKDRIRHGTHSETRKTHCPQGHPYDAENTDHYRGTRRCKTCQSEHSRAQWRAKRAAERAKVSRVCRRCGNAIPSNKRVDARYCSDACRKSREAVR